MKSNITFVTSYMKIYDSEYDESKTFFKRLQLFIKIVELNINICLFISHEYESIFHDLAIKYKNLKIIQIHSIEDLEISKLLKDNDNEIFYNLPQKRSEIKDLPNYMILMNSKIDFLYRTITNNPFNSEYFFWFDFSLPYIFNNIEKSLAEIKKYAYRNYVGSFIAIPGCWNHKIYDIEFLKRQVVWRFCGGFFIGDKKSLLNFYDISIKNFKGFLKLTNTLLWEVNYWAWLESCNYINVLWFEADHNDTIIKIPSHLYTVCIQQFTDKICNYNFPNIISSDNDKFFVSSSSYIYDYINNKHILNSRYVNYYYKDNWDCDFFNVMRQIRNINVKSELNDSFIPNDYNLMNVEDDKLILNFNAFSIGLEDIRLYHDNDTIKFIASNINYNSYGKSRMIIGDYDYENNICKNLKLINMRWESKCEKNWSPIPSYIDNNKLFIYKWSPFTVGFIDTENYFKIAIEKKYEDHMVNKFRGSTTFIKYDDNYFIGLVHYSIPGIPPIYYHALVLLDNKTNLPLFYSDPFKFSEKPIEFCIGFTIIDTKYLFWFSQMDREPLFIQIEMSMIPILNVVY